MTLHCIWLTPKKYYLIGQKLLEKEIATNVHHHHISNLTDGLNIFKKYSIDLCVWKGYDFEEQQKLIKSSPESNNVIHIYLIENNTIPDRVFNWDIIEWIKLPLRKEQLLETIIKRIGSRFHPNKKQSAFKNTLVIPMSKNNTNCHFIPLDQIYKIEEVKEGVLIEQHNKKMEKYRVPFLWIKIQLENSLNFFNVSSFLIVNLNSIREICFNNDKKNYCLFSNESELSLRTSEKKDLLNYVDMISKSNILKNTQ